MEMLVFFWPIFHKKKFIQFQLNKSTGTLFIIDIDHDNTSIVCYYFNKLLLGKSTFKQFQREHSFSLVFHTKTILALKYLIKIRNKQIHTLFTQQHLLRHTFLI